MFTFKDIKDIIDNNQEKFNNESLIIVRKDNKFGFLRSYLSFLNVEGFYDFFTNNEQIFKDYKHGEVAGFWCDTYGTIIEKKDDKYDGNYRSLVYNMSFGGRDSAFLNMENWFKSNYKMVDDNSEVVCIAMDDKFGYIVDSVEIKDKLTFDYNDSYGHKTVVNYKYPCVVLNLGNEIKQDIKKEYKKESKVNNFKNFIKNRK